MQSLADEVIVNRIEQSTEVARNFANSYLDTVGRQMGFNLLLTERDIVLAQVQGVGPEQAPIGYRRLLVGLAEIYQFEGLTHVDKDGRIVARAFPGIEPQPLPPTAQRLTRHRSSTSLQAMTRPRPASPPRIRRRQPPTASRAHPPRPPRR